jgi:hypothetical protein
MKFDILMGVPEMKEYWDNLCRKADTHKLGDETKLFKKLVKALNFLSNDPNHNSLSTHEIKPLTLRYGRKIWQSYLENRTPAAGRIFWTYGPSKNQITILGIEPHPEDKKRSGYQKVKLSNLPI